MESKASQLSAQLAEILRRIYCMKPTSAMALDGVSSSEMMALSCIRAINAHGGQASPSSLAELLKITKSASSQTLRSLEDKGLVTRERSEKDSRCVILTPTEEGMALIEEARIRRDEVFGGLIEAIGEEDMETLVRISKKVLAYQEQNGFTFEEKFLAPPAV